jgi:hypothetical protein
MNITDFEAPPYPASFAAALVAIFARQRELMEKYKIIEGLPESPVSLHTPAGQRVIRDFAQRVNEEMAESYEAWRRHSAESKERELHAIEELSDALHFLVELMIFASVPPQAYLAYCESQSYDHFPAHVFGRSLEENYWGSQYALNIALNYLRNKAWKTSQVPTDEARFRQALLLAFRAHLQLWTNLDQTPEQLWAFYMRKAQVNSFRQRSQY